MSSKKLFLVDPTPGVFLTDSAMANPYPHLLSGKKLWEQDGGGMSPSSMREMRETSYGLHMQIL